MRLIDADALDAEMYRKSFEVDDGRNVWNSGLWIRYKIFEEAIREAPTVDAVPVRHGHWQITDAYPHNVHCSVCHKRFAQTHWGVWEDGSLPRNYCPNCGARMVEDE